MSRIRKKEIRKAIVRAMDMLERNTNPCDTFEGVLNREYSRALGNLIALGKKFLAQRNLVSRSIRRSTHN